MGKFTGHSITSDSALGSAVIQRSLRFNRADAPYLQATLGNSNVDKWTWSGWVKKTVNGQHQNIFSSGSDSVVTMINFDNSDYLKFQNWHSGQRGTKITNRKFRDNSAWMHIVAIWDSGNSTADDRIRLYVNGTRETDFSSSSNPDQNQDSVINGNTLGGSDYGEGKHFIGRYADLTDPSGTYKTEIHFIDGQAYDPSYFGFTDPVTGIWMPKRYEGTYGTNGFYLDFSDNTSTTTLGIDKSPNGNDFTLNNFSVSAGAGNDSLEDTPTNNFCTLNALHKDSNTTLTNGNLQAAGSSSTEYATNTQGTFAQSSGKWYYEVEYTSNAGGNNSDLLAVGWARTTIRFSDNPTVSGGLCYRPANADYVDLNGNDTSDDKPQTSTGNVIQVAIDLDAGKIWFGNGGTFFESGNPATGANATLTFTGGAETLSPFVRTLSSTLNFNFGQRAFSYTVPTGYKTLESRNLPPTSPSVVRPKKHFQPLLYTGQNTSSLYNVTGLEFAPDFVWAKARNDTIGHIFIDTVRGDDKQLEGNLSDAEVTRGTPSYRFLKDGFAVSTGGNMNNPVNYVAFCWKAGGAAVSNTDGSITSSVSANTEAGFSIVTFSITSNAVYTVGHGLGKAPQWIMMKARNTTNNWDCYHVSVGNTKRLLLNTNDTPQDYTGPWNDTTPTSSVFTSTGSWLGGNGTNCVAYCWTEIPGYSKFGTYTGNASTDGTYVHLGFRPALVIFKSTSATENWQMKNSKQIGYNDQNHSFFCNNENVEYTTAQMDFLSNGFKLRNSGGGSNGSGETLVYMAWAEEPGSTPFDTFPNAR